VEAAWNTLSVGERDVADGFSAEADRTLYVIAHGLLRGALALYAGLPARELRFRTQALGRPELVTQPPHAPEPLRFSLSHTAGLAGCAVVWGRDVGFDVERLRAPAPVEIAQRFFAAGEVDALLSAPAALQGDLFGRLWTLKEAYLKALGTGLRRALSSFEVGFVAGRATLHAAPAGDGGGCFLHSWRLDDCRAAVAVRGSGEGWDVRNLQSRPLGELIAQAEGRGCPGGAALPLATHRC
jgi:4'-phosphopantetheinyl transferase